MWTHPTYRESPATTHPSQPCSASPAAAQSQLILGALHAQVLSSTPASLLSSLNCALLLPLHKPCTAVKWSLWSQAESFLVPFNAWNLLQQFQTWLLCCWKQMMGEVTAHQNDARLQLQGGSTSAHLFPGLHCALGCSFAWHLWRH